MKPKYDIPLGNNLPVVTSINGFSLERAGFVKDGLTFTKGELVVKYDGVKWWNNGSPVQFIEEIKKPLKS